MDQKLCHISDIFKFSVRRNSFLEGVFSVSGRSVAKFSNTGKSCSFKVVGFF